MPAQRPSPHRVEYRPSNKLRWPLKLIADKMFDDVYEFRLSYDLPMTAIPKPTVLPAGGGEPGAVYATLVKAIQVNDWTAAHAKLPPDQVPETKPKTSIPTDPVTRVTAVV